MHTGLDGHLRRLALWRMGDRTLGRVSHEGEGCRHIWLGEKNSLNTKDKYLVVGFTRNIYVNKRCKNSLEQREQKFEKKKKK